MSNASATLPFEPFLELLRAKGFGVGLHEFNATANLLDHWDRTSVLELGDALAAIIGRSADEVDGIRRLFREVYAPPPPVRSLVAAEPPVRLSFLRRHAWTIAAAAAILLAVIATVIVVRAPADAPVPASPPIVPPVVTPAAERAVTVPPPPEPDPPPAPMRVERRPTAAAFSAVFLASLAFFWSLKVREKRRAWLRQAWSTIRGALPGPYHFDEVVRDRPARLPKTEIEDAATVLGRVFGKRGQARTLDVPATLRATLRRGLMTTLVTKPRRIAESILVLQDVGQAMRLWDAKVDGFLRDLRRQGIALERMYFDGDLARVSDRPHRPATSLESVFRARTDAPVLIVGSGSGLAALVASADQRWMRHLAQRSRKAWVTPVSDVRLWPAEFNVLPVDVWPMTRLGLINAARQLAGVERAADLRTRAQVEEEGRISVQDIERLKRLASLAPRSSPALIDLLRRRFAPDIPDAALLHLMLETSSAGSPVVRLSASEMGRLLAAVRSENPDLELAARKLILDVDSDSEPTPGSLAHERWRIAVASQELAIATLTGDSSGSASARAALTDLAEGPVWDEAQEAIADLPRATAATRAKAEDRQPRRVLTTSPPDNRRWLSNAEMPWSWPGVRELVPAAVVAVLIVGVAFAANALPVRAVQHLTNVYDLQYAAIPTVSTPRLSIALKNVGPDIPRIVDLYQGDQRFRAGVALTGDVPATVALTSADTGKYYQARGRLTEGNLALSPYVWVTSDQLSFVLIDALPWANVTIVGNGTPSGSEQTPFTAALTPGTYQLRFDNPNLSPPATLNQTITVPAPGNSVRVTMPGFDPARAVDALLPRGASRQ